MAMVKRRNVNICLIILLVLMLSAGVQAKVTGNCSNCHTMHNSQNGSRVDASGPNEFLLNKGGGTVTTCWGCHAQGTANNIDSITGAPQVMHTNAADLAGGNYAYIKGFKSLGTGATTLNAGHNVADTGVTDSVLTSPPGDQNATGVTNINLTCAGQYGCHGDRSIATVGLAVKGAHHYNDTALKFGTINTANQALSTGTTGQKVGSSYRFLMGVKGGENANWEATVSSSNHNEYSGAANKGVEAAISSPGNTYSINGLCAECHGKFHGPAAGDITNSTGSPWLRHPTDIVLPNSGEYTAYNTDNSYNPTVPLARQTIPNAPIGTVTPGTDVIMCLSCHRAHASANYKMLRWDIKNATLSTAISGCNVCHTSKN